MEMTLVISDYKQFLFRVTPILKLKKLLKCIFRDFSSDIISSMKTLPNIELRFTDYTMICLKPSDKL